MGQAHPHRHAHTLHKHTPHSFLPTRPPTTSLTNHECNPPPQDGNLGLVKQVVASLTVRSVQRLTQTFLTLPLADIAASAGLAGAAEAEEHILRWVAGRRRRRGRALCRVVGFAWVGGWRAEGFMRGVGSAGRVGRA